MMKQDEFPRPAWLALRTPHARVSIRLDRRLPLVVAALLPALLLALVISVSYGEFHIGYLDVMKAVMVMGMDTGDSRHALVVQNFRLPRILLALLIGVALAVSGTINQGVTRNDLADPGLLGINAGAGVLVVGYLTLATVPDTRLLPWLALAGGLGAALLIYLMTWKGGSSTLRLVLLGVGVSAFGAALINYFITRLEVDSAQRAFVWLTGSVYGSTWADVRLLAVWAALLIPPTVLMARHLNVLGLGDDAAASLGLRVEITRLMLIAISAALAAITVTVAGTIAFAGLVAPHIARRLVGPAHEGLLLVSALVGGLLLVVADLAARAVIAPEELPIGVTIALIGGPFFAWLLYKRGR